MRNERSPNGLRTLGTLAAALLLPNTVLAQPAPESVYAPPEPPPERSGTNEGAVKFDLDVRYMTDYVYRGVEFLEVPAAEDRLNLQFEGKIRFDLGKLPHPFVSVFTNVADSDPISDFQEIRPTVGFDWPIRPLTISAGYTSYIFPDRGSLDTNEVFARLELDDSLIWQTRRPVLSPYVMAAYDWDLYDGIYAEAGLQHTWDVEDYGLTLTLRGHVAYVNGISAFAVDPVADDSPSGFQHYQLSATGVYSLNELLNISRRYGQWSLVGYLNYTDGMDEDLRATTQLWGGVGLRFSY